MPDNRAIVLDHMARIARGDLDGALALATDDAVFRSPDGSELDKAGLRALFSQLAPLLVNPLDQTIVGTTCEGDRVAVEATAATLLANGQTYRNRYHFLFELRDGRIVSSREYCDTRATDVFA
ncbi:nuclear transport factor 2 family protein [Sphingomonas profundi]|uniref:nuclear transport factor 2 family protein n=1 Tax=Alterirhizorhabdus profundi TaxID=2681549 RepID=UPI0012E73017|nr:nuclear transport factor 2 family protein [Sphingomonas profundi]